MKKFTKEYAEKLADSIVLIRETRYQKGLHDGIQAGYLKALEDGNVKELVEALEFCMSELYMMHSKYGDKQNARDHSPALTFSEQAINKLNHAS